MKEVYQPLPGYLLRIMVHTRDIVDISHDEFGTHVRVLIDGDPSEFWNVLSVFDDGEIAIYGHMPYKVFLKPCGPQEGEPDETT